MEWFKRIEAEEVVKLCIKQGVFKVRYLPYYHR